MEIKDRIAEIIKAKGVTSQQFAEITNTQSSTISHILSERNKPSLNVVMSIIESLPEINPDWLLTGNGSMYRCENGDEALNEPNFDQTGDTIYDGVFGQNSTVSTNVAPERATTYGNNSAKAALNTTTTTPVGSYNSDLQMFDNCENIEKIMVFYKDKSFDIYIPR